MRWSVSVTLVTLACASQPLPPPQAAAPAAAATVVLPTPQASAVAPPQRRGLTPGEIAGIAKPSVVVVRTPGGTGAGFVVAPGKVVTALHVVAGSSVISVRDESGSERAVYIVVTYNRADDLALLAVSGVKASPLPLARSAAVGDPVVAIGHPLGLEGTVSTGVVSAIRATGETSFLQISAPISPGSSGGPVLNSFGEVVGLAHGILTEGQALNFATPASRIASLIGENAGGFPVADFAAMTANPPPAQAAASPKPAQAAPPPRPSGPRYPDAVAGFAFGSTLRALLDACPDLVAGQSGQAAACPYHAVRVPFASGRVTFTLTNGEVTAITIYPDSRQDAAKAMVQKYGQPNVTLEWKKERWEPAKSWPEGRAGGYEWDAIDGSIIRLGRIKKEYFLTFVLQAQYDAEHQSY